MKLNLSVVKLHNNDIDTNNSDTSKNEQTLFVTKMHPDFSSNPIVLNIRSDVGNHI